MYTKRDIITHIKEYYSAIKNEIMPFVATWIDLESIMPSEIRQRLYDMTYMWNLKTIQINVYVKQSHRYRKQAFGYQRKEGREEVQI